MLLLVSVILFIVLLFLLYFTYAGLFRRVEIRVTKSPFPIGGHYFYKFYQMGYREGAGQAFRSIEKFPIKVSHKKVGIYYDDPDKVKEDMTRFTVGIFMLDEDFDEELAANLENVGFQHSKLPNVDSIVTTSFPLRSILSILFAVWKVYPKLKEFTETKKLLAHPFIEFYEGKEVHFVAPLEKNEQFYVPDFHETPTEFLDGTVTSKPGC